MIRTRRTATALTAAAALALGVLPAAFTTTAILAGGEEPTTLSPATALNPAYNSAGKLTLATSATAGSITRTNALGVVVGTAQDLKPDANCLLTTNGNLLGITGNFTGASFAGGSIGVAEKKSGQSCSQVGVPDEVLTLTLNSTLSGATNPTLIESAALDIEAKQSARIVATAKNAAGGTVGVFELQSGTESNKDPLNPTATVFQCSSSADSGPDSGANDNCRWTIERPGVVFASLVLEVKNGSFSLEGGADGTGTEPSVFKLVQPDGMLTCPTSTSTAGTETIVRRLDGDKPEVKVRRIGNADASDCVALPYTLANGPGLATFYKPLNIETRAQFIVSLKWRFPAQPYTTVPETGSTPEYKTPSPADLPAPKIDFEVAGDPGDVKMGWCLDPKFSTTDPNRLEGINSPMTAPDMEPNLPYTQHACIGIRMAKAVKLEDKDYYEVTEQVYLQGDAAWRP